MNLDKSLIDFLVNIHKYFKQLKSCDNNFKQKIYDINKLKYNVCDFLKIIESCESVDNWYEDNIRFYKKGLY